MTFVMLPCMYEDGSVSGLHWVLAKATTDRHPPSPTSQTGTLLREMWSYASTRTETTVERLGSQICTTPHHVGHIHSFNHALVFHAHIGILLGNSVPTNGASNQGTLEAKPGTPTRLGLTTLGCLGIFRPTLTQNNGVSTASTIFDPITPTNAEMLTVCGSANIAGANVPHVMPATSPLSLTT